MAEMRGGENARGAKGKGLPRPRTVRIKTRHGKRLVCLPPQLRAGPPARSLILALHGGHGTAYAFAERSGLCEAFHAFGHDITFPQALTHWADGRPPLEAGWPADRDFIETLHAKSRDALDADAVPLALIGSSNGGMLTQRYAIEARIKPAISVAVVSALPEALAQAAGGAPDPTPMMLIQGAADPVIPWSGGEVLDIGGKTVKGRLLSIDDTVAFWKTRNRISAPPRDARLRIDGQPAEFRYWPGGEDGADLWFVVVEGRGHRLLDGEPRSPRPGSLEDFIARTVMWYVDRETLTPHAGTF
ncbi:MULTISPECIES: PHB depolymerase family esterase [unclassified Roseivivax]|uniref:alpha/beta hydrolase family esterase n=1 Tax=unclassified Roseivivax TaxID=2639302 RepID=UPI001267AD81|nr:MULTISPECIES: hypothetical protein [unclassified Roseivivax]